MRDYQGASGLTGESSPLGSVLDVSCGSRMFHFNKNNPSVVYADLRNEAHTLCDGRALNINPDIQLDFRSLPFSPDSFSVVIFDPPHLKNAGASSWLAKKYGLLSSDWQADLTKGFAECFRVLKPDGVLIFKWCEDQIKVKEILALTPYQPLIGHKSGKQMRTHWITFMKAGSHANRD